VIKARAMDIQELGKQLDDLVVGQYLGLSLEILEELFPPGLEDDFAFIKASNFAAEHGCHMTRAPKEIVYTKWDREVERWEMTSKGPRPVIS